MIAIVDYRAGNVTSVKKALNHLGVDSIVTHDPRMISAATRIVLPGVGHFSSTAVLAETGLRAAIEDRLVQKVPFLGICVGMQWMFEGSEEAPGSRGLSTFAGQCCRFPVEVKSPHVGWNSLVCDPRSRLLRGVPSGSFVYFTHSYRVPVGPSTVARCEYGGEFSAVVEQENLFGVQFHPEKSAAAGLKILENFCSIC